MKKFLLRLKLTLLIGALVFGCTGVAAGAFAWGAIKSGKVLHVSVNYTPDSFELSDNELKQIAVLGRVQR